MNSSEAAIGSVLEENVFLEISQDSQENICTRVSFLMKLQACEIFKNTFFTEHFRAAASEPMIFWWFQLINSPKH